MVDITVNGKPVAAEKGELLLRALQRADVQIPTLCYMKDRFPSGACRMCVVEVDGQQNLVPSCAFPVQDGMKIQTHSPRVLRARTTILELLLANHPDECLYCVRSGDCELQCLAQNLGVRKRRFFKIDKPRQIDVSSHSIIRDQAKCILCGRCVRVCEEVMGVSAIDFIGRGSGTTIGPAFDGTIGESSCISCGQCIVACPTGSLREQGHTEYVQAALANPDKVVVVQHAPSVSVTLGEYFGLPPGTDVDGLLVAALRRIGFQYVFDTAFGADLTIMEEATELIDRIVHGKPLPMMTSCSPGWVSFVESQYPEIIPNLSTCKSPQQMLGAMIKTFFASRQSLDPQSIFNVAIMPCTAKKSERARPELLSKAALHDVDAVLTTRELARLIRKCGIDLNDLRPEPADDLFGLRSSAGKIFGATGGVMEAAIRTAAHLLTGTELQNLTFEQIRGLEGIKETTVTIGDRTLRVAVANGLGNARRLLDEMRTGTHAYDFIEVMTCPGGCIAGGGQPRPVDVGRIRARMQALYDIDRRATMRVSHENPAVQRLYSEFLGAPLGPRSHELLHTSYTPREEVL
jgi:NADP-reducing hydrogenase subunit HndD